MVSKVKNVCASAVQPTQIPNKMVMIYIKLLANVCVIFGTTPLSFTKLPNIKQPIKGAAEGTNKHVIAVTTIGKRIFSVFETSLGVSILI